MSAVKKVEEVVEGAVKGRKKQLKKAQNLRDKGKKKPAGQKRKKRKAAQTERAQTRTEASAITGGSDVRTTKSSAENVRRMPKTETAPEETGSGVRTTEEEPRQTTTGDGQATRTETPQEQPEGGAVDNAQTSDAPAKEQVAQSGGEYNPLEYAEKAKDKNLSRSERYMYSRLGNMRKNALKVFDNGTGEQIENELGRWGIEKREGAAAADYMKDIDEILRKKAESGPTLGDKFRSHHGVGLTGLGVVGVSTLDLASSRGQQSNAQLYSDPFA